VRACRFEGFQAAEELADDVTEGLSQLTVQRETCPFRGVDETEDPRPMLSVSDGERYASRAMFAHRLMGVKMRDVQLYPCPSCGAETGNTPAVGNGTANGK
jgi:hypothetical protein